MEMNDDEYDVELARARRRRSPLIVIGALAAVLAMIALGLVAVVGDGATDDVVTPVTEPGS